MTWLLFVVASFAAYRMGRMVAEEDGPMFVFKRIRDAYTSDKSSFAVGIRCFYCVSFWMALAVVVVVVIFAQVDPWLFPLWWFGIAGLAAKIHEYWNMKK